MKLNFKGISYIEAYGNYIKIYTNKMILASQTLSDFLREVATVFYKNS